VAAALPDLQLGEPLEIRVGASSAVGAMGAMRAVDPMGAVRALHATWARAFGEVPRGAPLLTVDSYGRASLAVHLGSAAASYGVTLDSPIEISRLPGGRRHS
jgi:S-adenosylmethionine hydrolase